MQIGLIRDAAYRLALVSIVMCMLFSLKAVAAWPSFSLAPKMESDWIAEHLVYNGMPMRIENFSCLCSVEDVLSYYRTKWGRLELGYVENDLGEYQQISRGTQRFFFSVQVKPDDFSDTESVGRLSIMRLPQHENDLIQLGLDIPRTDGTTVITDVFDAVPGKKIRTVTMANHMTLMDNTRYYQRIYENQGWQSMLVPVSPSLGTQALSYRREKTDVNIVFYSSQVGTNILFNEVKSAY